LDQGAISWGAFDRAAEKALETLDKFDVAAETAKIQATIASPFQKFAHEMSAVNKLFARGAITQSIVDQARTHFVDEIFNKNDQLSKSEQRGTPALAMGSVEFGKALQQAQKDVLIGDDDAKKISEKQLRELEKISEAVAHFAIARF
jgi:multidrug resistance efflux pump